MFSKAVPCHTTIMLSFKTVGNLVLCPLIYGFWLPLWYLQTLLILKQKSLGGKLNCRRYLLYGNVPLVLSISQLRSQ